MTTDALLERLQDASPDGPLDQLAVLVVDQQLERPLRQAIDPLRTAELLGASLRSWCDSKDAEEQLVQSWQREIDRLGAEDGRLGELASDDLQSQLKKLAAEPHAIDRELLLALLDRAPFRALIRELLVETLQNFAQRMSTPVADSKVAKRVLGISQRARDRARSHSGSLGSLADAVSGGVERQLERRVSAFADSALSNVLQRIADYLCSPERAADQVALRLGLLDGLWELRVSQLAGELNRSNLHASAAMLRSSAQAWVDGPDFQEKTSEWIAARLDATEERSISSLLEDLGVRDDLRDYAIERTRNELSCLVESDAFGLWFQALSNSTP